MINASNRKEIRRAEKASELAERNRVNFICAAMSTSAGRIWFHDLLSSCHIFADPFRGDALVEAYSKGERNVGLKIYHAIVTNCLDDFVLMMKEIKQLEQIDASRESAGADSDDHGDGSASDDEFARSEDGDGRVEGSIGTDVYGAET
jgi:hypothetical protein